MFSNISNIKFVAFSIGIFQPYHKEKTTCIPFFCFSQSSYYTWPSGMIHRFVDQHHRIIGSSKGWGHPHKKNTMVSSVHGFSSCFLKQHHGFHHVFFILVFHTAVFMVGFSWCSHWPSSMARRFHFQWAMICEKGLPNGHLWKTLENQYFHFQLPNGPTFKSKKAIDVFFKPRAQSMSVDESDDEGMQCAVQWNPGCDRNHREVSTIFTRGWWVLLGKSLEIPTENGDLSGIQLEYHWDIPKKAMTKSLRTGNAGPFSSMIYLWKIVIFRKKLLYTRG